MGQLETMSTGSGEQEVASARPEDFLRMPQEIHRPTSNFRFGRLALFSRGGGDISAAPIPVRSNGPAALGKVSTGGALPSN